MENPGKNYFLLSGRKTGNIQEKNYAYLIISQNEG